MQLSPEEDAGRQIAPALIRVMICDDSSVVRAALARALASARDISVVAKVGDGSAAIDYVRRHDVDVVMLDIEMPVMDGLTALPLLLAAAPKIAVIMVSSQTTAGAAVSMKALRLGAAEYLCKPTAEMAEDQRFSASLIAMVRGFGRMRRPRPATLAAASLVLRPAPRLSPRLLAIGSSTGGPNALFALVQQLSPALPVPVLITQHLPAGFTAVLAQTIARLGVLPCTEAKEGDAVLPGRILLAPGDRHMLIRRQGAHMVVHLADTPPENFCRPSIDPMLRSACDAVDGRVLVAMLTGMGRDGLLGSRKIIEAGGALVAQDEASSVVWGMPGAVAKAGLAHAVLPLSQIGAHVTAMVAGLAAADARR